MTYQLLIAERQQAQTCPHCGAETWLVTVHVQSRIAGCPEHHAEEE